MSEGRYCKNCGRSSHRVNVTCKQMCLTCYGYRNDPEKLKRVREKFNQDATIARLTRELDKAKEGLAAAIIHAGLATGHGDTVDDLLQELREQVARLTQELEEARDNKEKYYSVWLDRCKEVTELQAENAALKAEVERLRELLYRQIEIDYTSEDAWKRISKYLNDDNCKGFLDSSRKSLIALRTRAEAAERKVEEAIERCNAAIEQGDCEASFDEFANIKQILEDK